MRKVYVISRLNLLILAVVSVSLTYFVVSGLRETRIENNELSAIAAVQELVNAQILYATTNEQKHFGSLAELQRMHIVNKSLATGVRDGYVFTVTPDGAAGFTVTAIPVRDGITGRRGFYSDQTGILRYSAGGAVPDSSSPAIP